MFGIGGVQWLKTNEVQVKSQYCVIYYKEYCKIFQVLGDKIKDSKICKNTLTKKEKQEDFI